MSDPTRLCSTDSSPVLRALLSAGRQEMPSERALQRTLMAVAAVSAATATSAAAAASGSAALKATSSIGSFSFVMKWVGVGAVAGLATAGAATQWTDAPTAPTQHVNPAAATRAQTATQPQSLPETVQEPAWDRVQSETDRVPERRTTAQPSAAVSAPVAGLEADLNMEALNREVQVLDATRAALASGDAEAAWARLDRYELEFSGGKLAEEALFLRMEAALQRGDSTAARAAATQLLADSPKGPHAARARAVLSDAK